MISEQVFQLLNDKCCNLFFDVSNLMHAMNTTQAYFLANSSGKWKEFLIFSTIAPGISSTTLKTLLILSNCLLEYVFGDQTKFNSTM